MIVIEDDIKIDKRAISIAKNDVAKSASIINLVYVTDKDAGFTRIKKGNDFYYTDGKKELTTTKHLERIKKLVIPPAWENVWICKNENGHLQATGTDKLKRKQYIYHPRWHKLRNHTKFFSLLQFGKSLPSIRAQLHQHLALSGYPQDKVLAAVVSLLDRTNIRIGNEIYEKLYGSFGLTTLKNRHVNVQGSNICFSFTGKKGIKHKINLHSKRLSRIIKGCKEIPGKTLFEYYDSEGNIHTIDSGMVNAYIQKITGQSFTAKDFRTWAGSVHCLSALKEIGDYDNESQLKNNINTALDYVAKQLGNTRAVCRKYYVHPVITELYAQKKLLKYFEKIEHTNEELYDENETVLLRILEKN